jgi:hypothetical protein
MVGVETTCIASGANASAWQNLASGLAACKELFTRHTMHSYYDILLKLRDAGQVFNIYIYMHSFTVHLADEVMKLARHLA